MSVTKSARQSGLQTEVISVTPDLAKRWIASTGERNFRSPSPKRVALLSRIMERGEWALNGESIKLSGDYVLDGLHRLHAVVESGCTIRTLVVTGLPMESMDSIDRGRPRTMGQQLSYMGVPSGPHVSSIMRSWHAYREGIWRASISHGVVGNSRQTTDREYLDFFEQNRERLIDATRMTDHVEGGISASALLPRTISGVILAEGTAAFDVPHESDQAEEFMRVLRMGGRDANDPLALLRNLLTAERTSNRRMNFGTKAALAIHAWNLFLQDKKVRSLHYRLSGPTARDYPKIMQAEV